jgi:hypothetical protein
MDRVCKLCRSYVLPADNVTGVCERCVKNAARCWEETSAVANFSPDNRRELTLPIQAPASF